MLSNAVVLKEANEPIGSVGIMFGDGVHSADMQEGDAEIGYWIGVPYRGKGLIPEAVNRLLVRCFDELGIKRVWCGYYDGNTKSRRVMDKCGFKYHHTEEGEISPLGDKRTEHFTLLTKDDWNKYGISKENAETEIRRINRNRIHHYEYYAGMKWGEPHHYTLMINTGSIGLETACRLVKDIYRKL